MSIISSIFGALITGGIVYFVLNGSYLEKRAQLNNQISVLQKRVDALRAEDETTQSSPTPTQSQLTTNQNTADWKTYENGELGISFRYPSNYGDFKVSVYNGEAGKNFTGDFQNNKFFSIGGTTADYTAGREGYFLDFARYLNEGGKYYHLWTLEGKMLVEPKKILSVDGQEVLIVDGDSYVEERNVDGPTLNPGSNGGALINLPGSGEFKGLAIWNSDIQVLPQSIFEEVVTTFKFAK